MGKKKTPGACNRIPPFIERQIPYRLVFEEEGMFESAPGVYSKAYRIGEVSAGDVKTINNAVVTERFAALLNQMPGKMTMQFIVHNQLIPMEGFLERAYVKPDKDSPINTWIGRYNRMVSDNSRIGHNNVRKNRYLILSVRAASPEQAVNIFRRADPHIRKLFFGICRLRIKALTSADRLGVMFAMLHPWENESGKNVFIKNDARIPAGELKRRHLTTKALIAPDRLDVTGKNYLILNGDTFVRTFFIVSIPSHVTGNLLSDIANSSSNMILSVIYEPLDARYGVREAERLVSENTTIREQAKRDTIKDRRDKTMLRIETMAEESEDTYFERAALKLMQEAVRNGERVLLATFIIAICAEDLETLDRDTRLLHISTSKYACQVKPLDLQQLQGLQTVLPLADNHVDCRRAFTAGRLAGMPPFSLQEALQKDGLFYGLNSINDNLILINRKNHKNLSGMIAGTEHSGKTFQCKREIFNAMISTEDRILVLSNTDEYDAFVKTLGGDTISSIRLNPFEITEHYGLRNPDQYAKSLYLEALFEVLTRPSEKIIAMSDLASVAEQEKITEERNGRIAKEVNALFRDTKEHKISLKDGIYLLRFIEANSAVYPTIAGCLPFFKRQLQGSKEEASSSARLRLYKYNNCTEAMALMDHLLNVQLKDKAEGRSSWLFIDSLDAVFSSDQAAAFLMDYVERMNVLENVFTIVVQSSVRLFTDNAASYRFCEFINQMGYEKLLNQGPIERKRFTELLNIPHSLVNYITATEPGKGILCTPSSDAAFNDNFYQEEDSRESTDFYRLFQL